MTMRPRLVLRYCGFAPASPDADRVSRSGGVLDPFMRVPGYRILGCSIWLRRPCHYAGKLEPRMIFHRRWASA